MKREGKGRWERKRMFEIEQTSVLSEQPRVMPSSHIHLNMLLLFL